MKRISLHVPRLTEMEYRQNLLAQPETMAYNRGRAIDAEGYDPATGCIQFPRARLPCSPMQTMRPPNSA